MTMRAGSRLLVQPIGLLVALGLAALGFQFFAVHAFEIGTDREYIPKAS